MSDKSKRLKDKNLISLYKRVLELNEVNQALEKEIKELRSAPLFIKSVNAIGELDAEVQALEKQIEGCRKRCILDAHKLLMAISTPISPDDFDRLIDDMKQIGK